VDDPYVYGAIAGANSLSDVYAMGGQPRTALSIVAFPTTGVEFDILGEIMRGGMSKLDEAGVALLGGHSVRDDEIKFGYAITGTVDIKNIKQNNGARPGNRLILTKPLGTGLITTALKKGKAAPEHVQRAVDTMLQLNRRASEIALEFRIESMTDITGFGLLGHALEVAKASRISLRIDHRALPILPGAPDYSRAGFCAGGLASNREFFAPDVRLNNSIPAEIQDILFDPQTSGGLLIFCRPENASALLLKLKAENIEAAEIGYAGEPNGNHWIECV
jgi:selenide,water dikinase